MEYLIVSAPTLEGLVGIVTDYIDNGWKPQGGPFVVSKTMWVGKPADDNGKLIAQAIIKTRACCGGCSNGKDESPC